MKNETPSYAPATHTLAIVSLVLSILGLAGILPLVGSIGGIISGRIARQEILDKPELYSGEGIARAGILLGWLGMAVGLLVCCLLLVGLLLFVPVRIG